MNTQSKPQFYYIKVEFKGGKNYIGMFLLSVNTVHQSEIIECH